MFQKKKKMLTPEQAEEIRIQEFFDRIVPSTGMANHNRRTSDSGTPCR